MIESFFLMAPQNKHYYNIKIDTKVSNFNQGLPILLGELNRLHSFDRNKVVLNLRKKGWTLKKIAQVTELSYQAISQILKNERKETNE